MSADMASRIAVLEERSQREQEEREEMNGDIKEIKRKVYEMASSFRTVKWIMGVVVLPLLAVTIRILLFQ